MYVQNSGNGSDFRKALTERAEHFALIAQYEGVPYELEESWPFRNFAIPLPIIGTICSEMNANC